MCHRRTFMRVRKKIYIYIYFMRASKYLPQAKVMRTWKYLPQPTAVKAHVFLNLPAWPWSYRGLWHTCWWYHPAGSWCHCSNTCHSIPARCMALSLCWGVHHPCPEWVGPSEPVRHRWPQGSALSAWLRPRPVAVWHTSETVSHKSRMPTNRLWTQ